jgi:hypothetical protein
MDETNTDKNGLATPKEFMKHLSTSLSFIYKLADTGRVPVVRIPSMGKNRKDLIRFRWTDIYNFIDNHYQVERE